MKLVLQVAMFVALLLRSATGQGIRAQELEHVAHNHHHHGHHHSHNHHGHLRRNTDAFDPADAVIPRCGVVDTDEETFQKIERIKRQWEEAHNNGDRRALQAITIPVDFHVIHDGVTGDISDSDITAQIGVMNAAFGPDFTFTFRQTTRHLNSVWYNSCLGLVETYAANIRATLGSVVEKEVLHIYTCNLPPGGIVGQGSLPWQPINPLVDSVVVGWQSFPGLVPTAFNNEGKTAVHEIGHWLGLYHTFRGEPNGCDFGDGVDDTPAQAFTYLNQFQFYPAGCGQGPDSLDTCQLDPGNDPTNNYMDYNADACIDTFTPGQRARMQFAYNYYRKPNPDTIATGDSCPEAIELATPSLVTYTTYGATFNISETSQMSPVCLWSRSPGLWFTTDAGGEVTITLTSIDLLEARMVVLRGRRSDNGEPPAWGCGVDIGNLVQQKMLCLGAFSTTSASKTISETFSEGLLYRYIILVSGGGFFAQLDVGTFTLEISIPDPDTDAPTKSPTGAPIDSVTDEPTKSPTRAPIGPVTDEPTKSPTRAPIDPVTDEPTKSPTRAPIDRVTDEPTKSPTRAPINPVMDEPTKSPTKAPIDPVTNEPTKSPTRAPIDPAVTNGPTKLPTRAPIDASVTDAPTSTPTRSPTPPRVFYYDCTLRPKKYRRILRRVCKLKARFFDGVCLCKP